MANKKLTDLPILDSLASNDLFYVVDVSDLTESGEGTSKSVVRNKFQDILSYANLAAFPVTGEVGKFYYAIDTDTYYTWNGTIYEEFGAGSIAIVTKTKAEIDTLISGNDLVPLTVYEITGVDVALYGGSTIYIQAITGNTLSLDGIGKFYNPKYNQAVLGFDVWTSAGTYSIGDKVHWGGKTWGNVAGNVGASTDLFTLDAEWSVISFNNTDYNIAYDAIKYDYVNDAIIYRNEQNSNIVSTSFTNLQEFNNNPIKVFMWGNLLNITDYVGIGMQNINNSYNENINFRGLFQTYFNFYNSSKQSNIIFENGSYQYNLTFDNSSYQNELTFDNNSSQDNLTFNNYSSQIALTETTGFKQSGLTLNYYTFDRTSIPMISNETGLVFYRDLPISTTATKMIVKEDNQLKEMDVPAGGTTNLSYTPSPTDGTVVSSSGTDATLTVVDGTNAGLVTPAMKTDWDAKQTAGQVQAIADAKVSDTAYDATSWNGVTTIAPSKNAVRDKFEDLDSKVVHNTGTETIAGAKTFSSNITIPSIGSPLILAVGSDGVVNGLPTATYPSLTELAYVKGVTSAIQTQLDGKQPLATVLTNTTAAFTTAQETKLAGIATGATANSSDATLLARANHTGTQTASTISDFDSASRAQTEAELVAGTNITITPSGTGATRQLTIASTGGGTPQTGQIIVTSGTSFTTPSTITTNTVFNIELIGGGGGGGGNAGGTSSGSGGGGGGYVFKRITGLNPSTTYTCAIGAGGAGGSSSDGTAGGSTTLNLGTIYTASGGGAGLQAVSSNGGAGGTGTNGDINITGQSGEDSGASGSTAVLSSIGGNSPKGWGLGGAAGRNTTAGKNATGYGGGGSAGKANATGGNGSSGIIFCQWYN